MLIFELCVISACPMPISNLKCLVSFCLLYPKYTTESSYVYTYHMYLIDVCTYGKRLNSYKPLVLSDERNFYMLIAIILIFQCTWT